MKKVNTLKFVALAVVALYAFWYSSTPASGHFIDGIDSILGQYGGGITQCIGPALVLGFFCWRKNFFYAALAGLWLGINLLNISTNFEDVLRINLPFLSETVLHGLGLAVLTLATLAGIIFTREAPTAPKTAAAPVQPPIAFGEEWLRQGRPIPAATPAYSSSGGGGNFNPIWVIAIIGGAIALYTHGAQWKYALTGSGGADTTPWPSDFQKALDQAKTEHKPILLDFTGSDWCSACMQLDETILDTKAFRDYLAKKVVFVEVDMPHNKNQSAALKQQNEQLCQKFNIQGFPTLIVLNTEGKIIGNMLGGPADDQVADYTTALKNYIERAAGN